MKNVFLLLCLFAGITSTSFAQLGKMQYEDAEQKFSEGNFQKAIELLDKAEKTNGKTNPMIEHLRIMSRIEIAKKNPGAETETIKIARREAESFLKKYDGDSRIEDKYREVYAAVNAIEALIESYNKNAAVDIAREDMDYNYMKEHYQFGMTEDALKANFPAYTESSINSEGTTKFVDFNEGALTFSLNPKTGKSYGYLSDIITTKDIDRTCSACKKVFDEQLAIMIKQLGPVFKKDIKEGRVNYQWTKGTRRTYLNWSCFNVRDDVMMGTTAISSFDDAFKN